MSEWWMKVLKLKRLNAICCTTIYIYRLPALVEVFAVVGAAVEVAGAAVGAVEAAVEVAGAAVEVTGASVEVAGAAVEVTGAAVEVAVIVASAGMVIVVISTD